MTDNEREAVIRAKYKNADPQCEGAFLLRLLDEQKEIGHSLLEACEVSRGELIKWYESDECDCPPEGHHCGRPRLRGSIDRLIATILKAKGL